MKFLIFKFRLSCTCDHFVLHTRKTCCLLVLSQKKVSLTKHVNEMDSSCDGLFFWKPASLSFENCIHIIGSQFFSRAQRHSNFFRQQLCMNNRTHMKMPGKLRNIFGITKKGANVEKTQLKMSKKLIKDCLKTRNSWQDLVLSFTNEQEFN